MNLKEKVIKGFGWTAVSKYLNQLLTMAIKIVLARILLPKHFGLVASAALTVNSIKAMSNFGQNYALVYRKENIFEAANTALVILLTLALFGCGLAYILAPFTADFFKDSSINLLVKVLSLSIFISSFGVVPRALLNKEFMFKQLFFVELLSVVMTGAVSIGLVFVLPVEQRVWCLVAGGLVGGSARATSSWIYARFKPLLQVRWKIAKELINYGKYCLGLSIVMYVYNNIDDFIVGRVIGITALGYYSFAYNFTYKIMVNASGLFGSITLPLYSKLQDDTKALKNAYLRALRYSSLLTTPLTAGIFILAPEMIKVLFGAKWLPATATFQILSLFCLMRGIDVTTGELYNGIGKPKLNQNLGVVTLACVAITIYPLALFYGIVGAALSLTIARAITLCVNFSICARVLKARILEIAQSLFPSISAAIAMVLLVYIAKNTIIREVTLINLLILTILGAIVYIVIVFLMNRKLLGEFKDLLRTGLIRK